MKTTSRNTRRRLFRLIDIDFLEPRYALDNSLFAAAVLLPGAERTHDLDLADLDGDGDLDAFITGDSGEGNQVWFGDGNGNLTDSGQRLGNADSIYASLGDLDGDGDTDAFVATRQGSRVWYNNGSGRFTDSGQVLGSDLGIDVALGDLDRDGDLDAFVANTTFVENTPGIPDRIYLNDGTGRFTDSGQLLGTTHSKSVELGDLDGDGDLDAVVGNGPTSEVEPNYVWLNNGRGVFTDSGQRIGLAQTQHVAIGDVDGDDDLDMFIANSDAAPDEVWRNDGRGTFVNTGQALDPGSPTSHVALGDLDNDGDLDAFVANWSQHPDTVWINDGSGFFTDSTLRLGNFTSSHVALADLDRDGDLDAAIASFAEQNTLYFNGTQPEQPEVAIAQGISVLYDPRTGALVLETDTDLAGFTLLSAAGILGGPDPSRLILSNLQGVRRLSLGRSSPGLSQQLLSSDLSVSGTLATGHPLSGADLVYSPNRFVDAWFVYRQDTGELAIDGNVQITVLEVVSTGGIFTATRPAVLDGLFDLYRPDKLFVLKPPGFEDLALGPAVQPGLNASSLAADLRFNGAKLPSGAISVSIVHISPLRLSANHPPIARNDSGFSTDANQPLQFSSQQLVSNDTDEDGDVLVLSESDETSLQEAQITLAIDGSLLYDPRTSQVLRALPPGLSINDQFGYVVTDRRDGFDSARVTIRVTGANDLPEPASDVFRAFENDDPVDITQLLLSNDRDVDFGDTLTITAIDISNTIGIVRLDESRIMYHPGRGFDRLRIDEIGTDSFSYTVTDRYGGMATASVTITVVGQTDQRGDLDGDGLVDLVDINLLCAGIRAAGGESRFDLDGNGAISFADLDVLIRGILNTTYGDANLDGRFDTSDLIQIFQAGEYSDSIEDNSAWNTGDWNCDREFDTADLVLAFQTGGFQQ